mmetsp:Transcript_17516/g.56426  ORF Transcript_17516/g.56426 Transcript_17516/m.56426 type:complete len:205 (-) Transcript_17516:1345-1959(-)
MMERILPTFSWGPHSTTAPRRCSSTRTGLRARARTATRATAGPASTPTMTCSMRLLFAWASPTIPRPLRHSVTYIGSTLPSTSPPTHSTTSKPPRSSAWTSSALTARAAWTTPWPRCAATWMWCLSGWRGFRPTWRWTRPRGRCTSPTLATPVSWPWMPIAGGMTGPRATTWAASTSAGRARSPSLSTASTAAPSRWRILRRSR